MRYRVLDSWRGIAALLVAAFHFPVSSYLHSALLVRHAYLFVDLFFLLSGFVIAHCLRDGLPNAAAFRTFMIRRLGRVYPLYAAMLLAFAGVEILKLAAAATADLHAQTAPFATGSSADPAAFTLHVLLLQVFGITDGLSWNWPDWSIAAEVWTYAVFGLTCLIAFAHRRAILCALCAIALAVLFERSNRGIEVTFDLGFVRCVYSFAAGALVYDLSQRIPFKLTGVLATACEWCAVVLVLGFVLLSGRNVTSFAAPLFFGLLIFVFAFEGGSISRFLSAGIFQVLGRLSYSIYMVHALIVLVFSLVASKLAGNGLDAVWRTDAYDGTSERILDVAGLVLPDVLTLGYLAVVLLISAFTWRFIENPARTAVNNRTLSKDAPRGLPA